MSEEYLWNRTGESDPEIARLEESLRALRYDPDRSRLAWPAIENRQRERRPWLWMLAAGVAAAALIAGISVILHERLSQNSGQAAWKLSWNGSTPRAVHRGQVVETGNDSGALLEADFIGEVTVGAESRLRVVESKKNEQRLALERGTIHALIWAPPKEFVVDTPSAKTIDLGCQYTLHVAADGNGLLKVETGWVAFEWRNLESFIPAGATCKTHPGQGPGIPYFDDAPAQLRAAVDRIDRNADKASLKIVLASARSRDGLTLWHLLSRTQGAERAEVFDRFQQLVQLPPSVTRDKILQGDPAAIDAAWNALDLGDTDWWREWKRKW